MARSAAAVRQTRPKNATQDRVKSGTPLPTSSERSKSMARQANDFSPHTSMSAHIKRMGR